MRISSLYSAVCPEFSFNILYILLVIVKCYHFLAFRQIFFPVQLIYCFRCDWETGPLDSRLKCHVIIHVLLFTLSFYNISIQPHSSHPYFLFHIFLSTSLQLVHSVSIHFTSFHACLGHGSYCWMLLLAVYRFSCMFFFPHCNSLCREVEPVLQNLLPSSMLVWSPLNLKMSKYGQAHIFIILKITYSNRLIQYYLNQIAFIRSEPWKIHLIGYNSAPLKVYTMQCYCH